MKKASHSKINFLFPKNPNSRQAADTIVLPFNSHKGHPQLLTSFKELLPQLKIAYDLGDFEGKEGDVTRVYIEGQPEKRAILLGLGEESKITIESLRRSYGVLVKYCLCHKYNSLNIVIPNIAHLKEEKVVRGATEGLLLPNYVFDQNKSKSSLSASNAKIVTNFNFIGIKHKKSEVIAEDVKQIIEAVYYARDLVNDNADQVTPLYLAECAQEIAKNNRSIKCTIFDKKQIQKEGMGLLLAVNRGSSIEPRFIILEYRGNPKSKDHTVFVGKGITYDTGGLNIKTMNMETMRCDMGGAAACLGTMMVISKLKPKINLTVVIPSTENGVDANSYKPGDVYTSYSGKTVEMMNSDAEGRLILADALAYAKENLSPSRMVSIATLTGAIDIAIGSAATGMMSTSDKFAEDFINAGEDSGELVWRMPLFEEYRDRLKSDFADIKSWNGRVAGACVAAAFLKDFVGEVPWLHLDIACTAYLTEPKKYLPKYATGVGIRMMVELLMKDRL